MIADGYGGQSAKDGSKPTGEAENRAIAPVSCDLCDQPAVH
jgi:hypothetical protein